MSGGKYEDPDNRQSGRDGETFLSTGIRGVEAVVRPQNWIESNSGTVNNGRVLVDHA